LEQANKEKPNPIEGQKHLFKEDSTPRERIARRISTRRSQIRPRMGLGTISIKKFPGEDDTAPLNKGYSQN